MQNNALAAEVVPSKVELTCADKSSSLQSSYELTVGIEHAGVIYVLHYALCSGEARWNDSELCEYFSCIAGWSGTNK